MTVDVRDFYGMKPRSVVHHEEVLLHAPNGEPVRVDTTIAPLVTALWEAGVPTLASCGGDSVRGAYIFFPTVDTARRALPTIALFRPDMPEMLADALDAVTVLSPADDSDSGCITVDGWAVYHRVLPVERRGECSIHFVSDETLAASA